MIDEVPAHEALYRALVDGDADAAVRRLEPGLDGFLAAYDFTPLEVAVSEGEGAARRYVVRRLLDAGVDPRETVDAILPRAAKTGDVELLELLMLGGAEDRPDESGSWALDVAAEANDRAMVELLLEVFPETAVESALWQAARAGHADLCQRLEAALDDPPAIDKARRRLRRTLRLRAASERLHRARQLCGAVDLGDPAAVATELRRGASPDAFLADWQGEPVSALQRAAGRADQRIADLLLKAGAAVDGPADEQGRLSSTTPLFAAIGARAFELARRLVGAGADVRTRWTEGPRSMTPLLALMLDGFDPDGVDLAGLRSLVKTLARAGAELDAQDDAGFTAVIWTARRPSSAVFETLLELGARTDIADGEGNTAATHAFFRSLTSTDEKKRQEFKRVRRALGSTVAHQLDVELMAAAFQGDEKRCRELLRRGADPAHRYEGWEAIRYAEVARHEQIVRLLASG